MASSVDFSAVASDLQKHVKKNPELLAERLKSDWKFEEYVSKETGVIDRRRLNRLKLADVGQPGGRRTGGTSFHPTSNVIKPSPRYGYVHKCKVDLLLDEDDQEKLYKSYLNEEEKIIKSGVYDKIPYEEIIIKLIIDKFRDNFHRKAFWKGVRDDNGTTPAAMINGLRKVLTDLVGVAEGIPSGNVFTGAAITSSNAVAQVIGVKNLVPEEFLDDDLVCVLPKAIKELYDTNYIALYGQSAFDAKLLTNGRDFIDRTNIEFKTELGLATAQKIVITHRNNLSLLMAGEGDIDNMTFEYSKRELAIMMDCRLGADVEWPEYVWMNDLA